MSVSLEVKTRALRPRSVRNKLRHEGRIPGIVNGYKIDSTAISVDGQEFKRLLREEGLNAVVGLTIDGVNYNTLIHQFTTDTDTCFPTARATGYANNNRFFIVHVKIPFLLSFLHPFNYSENHSNF